MRPADAIMSDMARIPDAFIDDCAAAIPACDVFQRAAARWRNPRAGFGTDD
jgi:hypothetical protein